MFGPTAVFVSARLLVHVQSHMLARDKVAVLAVLVEAECTSEAAADVDLSRRSRRSLYFPKTTVVRPLREGLPDTEDAALRLLDEVFGHHKTRRAPRCVGDGAARGTAFVPLTKNGSTSLSAVLLTGNGDSVKLTPA